MLLIQRSFCRKCRLCFATGFLVLALGYLCLFSTYAAFAQDNFDFLPSLPGSDETQPLEADAFDFEQTPEEVEEELRREAFDAALEGLLPLRPEEIRTLLEAYDNTQDAVNDPVNPIPTPEFTVETLSLDPGSKPTTITVAHGFVTTLNIVDSTGAPWPIQDITWAGDFEIVEVSGEGSGHFIRIAPQSQYAYGNMSVHMLSLQTPIIISLNTSKEKVHYRFDAIIPEAGPMARASLIETGMSSITAGDADMTSLLQGIVPPDAARLSVSGVDNRTTAYRYNGMTYLRTPLSLLSPAWNSSTSSADGMRVYALAHAPVLLLSDKGRMVRARLSEREDLSDE